MWMTIQSTLPQSLTGLYPAALGESDPSNSTLGGIKLLQAASKGQSGVAWSAFREGWAKSMMQLIRIGAYYRASEMDEDGMIRIDDTLIDLEDLRDGNWACEPDGDESYPNTRSERKEAMQEFLQTPWAGPVMQLPKNQALAKDLCGLQDLEIPGAETEELQMSAVKQMLEEPPIPLPAFMEYQLAVKVATLTGQPPPPKPPDELLFECSLPIDPEVDDAQASYTVLQGWLRSATGQQAKVVKPEGYVNVRLRMLAYKAQNVKDQAAAQQKAQQQMLLQEAAKHPPKAPKDPSESLSVGYKDLGPSGKIQAAAKMGLDVTADVAADLAATHMSSGKQPPPKPPNGKALSSTNSAKLPVQ
jgi:hypothetical protein